MLAVKFPIQCHWDDDGRDSRVCPDFTCGRETTCGSFGKICGGYDTKGRNDDISLTIPAPAGDEYTYYVTMDFIKIDDWFASLAVSSNPVV